MIPLKPDLSIVIPVYNQEAHLEEALFTLIPFLKELDIAWQMILVDDGSLDRSPEVIRTFARRSEIVPVFHTKNQGKGAALRSGISMATGQWILFFDADLAYGTQAIAEFWNRAQSAPEHLKIIIGSRKEHGFLYPFQRQLSSKLFNVIVQMLFDLPFEDTQCGFKGFRNEVAKSLFLSSHVQGFAIDVEILFLATQRHLNIQIMPVSMQSHQSSSVKLFKHSFSMLRELLSIKIKAMYRS